jgi:hypothetical protein
MSELRRRRLRDYRHWQPETRKCALVFGSSLFIAIQMLPMSVVTGGSADPFGPFRDRKPMVAILGFFFLLLLFRLLVCEVGKNMPKIGSIIRTTFSYFCPTSPPYCECDFVKGPGNIRFYLS